jgi:hypothetical protein
MKTMTQDELSEEAERRFGENVRNWKFVCPACGTVQSVQQLLDAVLAAGGKKDDVHRYIGFSCIGRFTSAGDAGISAKSKGKKWDKGCNWTLGGLLRIHEMEVTMPDGHARPTFELAEAEPVAVR